MRLHMFTLRECTFSIKQIIVIPAKAGIHEHDVTK
jgi:hypothetical protein